MKRNHVLWVLSIASVGLAGLVTTIAPVRDARGCGGQQWACVAQARTAASWEVDPTGVPTDGAVRVHVEEESTCGYASGGGSPSITVRGPDAAVIAGTVLVRAISPTDPAKPSMQATWSTLEWRPDAPLLPVTSYTLTIELASGPKALAFTTGAGPFGPLKPVLQTPGLSTTIRETGTMICCGQPGGSGCGYSGPMQTCAQETSEAVPVFTGKADVDEPVAAAKVFMVNEIHLSVDDGDFTPFADVAAAKKTICARALTYNLLTYKHATSDPWCGSVAALDRTSVPNCAAMLNVLTKCGLAPPSTATMPTPGLLLSPSVMVATDTYTLACGGGQGGGGGSAGAAGGGAAGGSGGANAGNGGAGEKAGNGSAGTSGANAGNAGQTAGTGSVGQTAGASGAGADGSVPAAAARPTSDDAGCTVAAAPTAGHGLGGLAALLAVSGMLRLRAARKSR